jgi:hypothetical protein
MPFNLLIFPLVGGYYFLMRSRPFKYLHQRIDRQKLIFNSAIAGIFLIFIAFIIKIIWTSVLPDSAHCLKRLLPFDALNAGTMMLSFFLGIIAAEGGNILFFNKAKWLVFAIHEIGSELEQLLESSANSKEMIQITLKNDKCYIGWVSALPIPQHSSYVRFSPAFSGYREKETKRLIFTDSYIDAYDTYIKSGEVTDLTTLTHLVINLDQVVTANVFSIEAYEKFKTQSSIKQHRRRKKPFRPNRANNQPPENKIDNRDTFDED